MSHYIVCNSPYLLPVSLPPQEPFASTSHAFSSLKGKFKEISSKYCKIQDGRSSSSRTPPMQIARIPYNIHSSSYSSLIQSCIDSNAFDLGKSIHTRMLSDDGFQPDTFLQTKILMLYARSGNVADIPVARQLFDEIPGRNSTSWNTMILCYSSHLHHAEVLELFFQMQMCGVFPDEFTFPSVVKAYAAKEDEHGVKQVHGFIIKTGLHCNSVVSGSLVDGYAWLGLMDDALIAFEGIDDKNIVSCNGVVRGFVRLMMWEEAWRIFCRMTACHGPSPNDFTFASTIRVCGALKSLERGRQVHAQLIRYGFQRSVFIGNSLINMYAKCGDKESCFQVFHSMDEKDQVTWNSIISCEAQFGQFKDVLAWFKKMLLSGFKSNPFNLGSMLMVCAGSAAIDIGQQVHSYLIRNSLDTGVILGSALVDMYSKSSCMVEAQRSFGRVVEKNTITWNALLIGYAQEGMAEEALEHFEKMKLANVQPDQFTFTSLLTLFAELEDEDRGKQIHAHIIRTIARKHLILETELVHMYAKCGNLGYAREIFQSMLERNVYSWNSLIAGFEQNGLAEEALELFHQMQRSGIKPDHFALATALSSCASLSNGKKGKQIHGYIVRNVHDDDFILQCTILDMYSKSGLINQACTFYSQLKKKDVILDNIMISAYVNCDRIYDARHLFDLMENRSTASWNSMLTGYAKEGLFDEMMRLFERMLEETNELDNLTFVTVLDFCASISALCQGKQLHASLIKRGCSHSSLVLDSALVDMYGKGGDIEYARTLFDKMNRRNIISWNAMIASYAKHGDGVEVLSLFDQMKQEGIYPNDITFLSVLTACSHRGLIEEGIEIFISMVEEHDIEAKVEHYTCMVDLLGRNGRLDDAMEVIEKMPVEPDVSAWGALLGACRVHQNIDLGRLATERLIELDPKNPGHYVLMSNIYAAAGRWEDAKEMRNLMKLVGISKEPGISWIEIDNEIQKFYAGDRTHPKSFEIDLILKDLLLQMKGMGYVLDASFVQCNVENEE